MPYDILTLDGGGSWALIEIEALVNLYGINSTGHQILGHFDLVAANSGGSLVLGGLVENKSLSEIRNLFLDESQRRSIFSPTREPGTLRDLAGIGPKYSAAAKLAALERLYPNAGTRPVEGIAAAMNITGKNGAAVHLLVVAFDYDHNRAVFFRSAPAGGADWGDGASSAMTLAGAIHASSNAPVNYFDAPAEYPGVPGRYWDGAITGCNNPILPALTEAVVLGQKPADLRILSLGSAALMLPLAAPGAQPSPYEAQRGSPGTLADLRKLSTSVLDDPPDAGTFIAHAVTGGSRGLTAPVVSRVVRMNPLISPLKGPGGIWTAPSGWTAAQFQYLAKIDMDAIEQNEVAYIQDFATYWLADKVPNQPIRANGTTLAAEIGYARFSEAKAAWSRLFP